MDDDLYLFHLRAWRDDGTKYGDGYIIGTITSGKIDYPERWAAFGLLASWQFADYAAAFVSSRGGWGEWTFSVVESHTPADIWLFGDEMGYV